MSSKSKNQHLGQELKYLHRLRCILFKLLNVLLDKNHLFFQKRRLLFEGFHIAEHFGHVLKRLVTCFCSKNPRTKGENWTSHQWTRWIDQRTGREFPPKHPQPRSFLSLWKMGSGEEVGWEVGSVRTMSSPVWLVWAMWFDKKWTINLTQHQHFSTTELNWNSLCEERKWKNLAPGKCQLHPRWSTNILSLYVSRNHVSGPSVCIPWSFQNRVHRWPASTGPQLNAGPQAPARVSHLTSLVGDRMTLRKLHVLTDIPNVE